MSDSKRKKLDIDQPSCSGLSMKKCEKKPTKMRIRKKRCYGKAFIIEEAKEDDSDEDDMIDDGDSDEELPHSNPYLEEPMEDVQFPEMTGGVWKTNDMEQVGDYLIRKYDPSSLHDESQSSTDTNSDEDPNILDEEILKQSLLPGTNDPKLWLLKCRIGEEQETVLHLMRKYVTYQNSDNQLSIKSAFTKNGLKGYIYVEAYRQQHISMAIEGLRSLIFPKKTQKMVPINEMTDTLQIRKVLALLKPQQYVRFKYGLYKNDLARVDCVDVEHKRAFLHIIPRINYQKPLQLADVRKRKTSKQSFKLRPPAKLFDPVKIQSIGGTVKREGDYHVFEKNKYSKTGFLYKGVPISALKIDGVTPIQPELLKFKVLETTPITTHSFSVGDVVIVIDGDLKNLKAKITGINQSIITAVPFNSVIKDELLFEPGELCKHFVVGDRVKVILGEYEGDTGIVIRVEENNTVFIFSDVNCSEVEILPKDIQLTHEISTGLTATGKFQWGDFVKVDIHLVGVIVTIKKEFVEVLTMQNKILLVKPQSLEKKREIPFAATVDADSNQIFRKDYVTVIDGLHKGQSGRIKHLYRQYVFLQSKEHTSNGGIFACKSRLVRLVGGRKIGNSDSQGVNQVAKAPISPHCSRGTTCVPETKVIIGRTVKITTGPYRCSVGLVKNVIGSVAQVELHSPQQTLSVNASHLEAIDDPTKFAFGSLDASTARTVRDAEETPRHGLRTPMYSTDFLLPYRVTSPLHTEIHSTTTEVDTTSVSRSPGERICSDSGVSSRYTSIYRYPYYRDAIPSRLDSDRESTITLADERKANSSRTATTDEILASTRKLVLEDAWNPRISNSPPRTSSRDLSTMTSSTADREKLMDFSDITAQQSTVSTRSFHGSTADFTERSRTCGFSLCEEAYKAHTTSTVSDVSEITDIVPQYFHKQLEEPWVTTDLEVFIANTHSMAGRIAMIKVVSDDICTVFLPGVNQVLRISANDLVPTTPKPSDVVKIIGGEFREAIGRLMSIDGIEGIVKLSDGNVRMIQMKYLCRKL